MLEQKMRGRYILSLKVSPNTQPLISETHTKLEHFTFWSEWFKNRSFSVQQNNSKTL